MFWSSKAPSDGDLLWMVGEPRRVPTTGNPVKCRERLGGGGGEGVGKMEDDKVL